MALYLDSAYLNHITYALLDMVGDLQTEEAVEKLA